MSIKKVRREYVDFFPLKLRWTGTLKRRRIYAHQTYIQQVRWNDKEICRIFTFDVSTYFNIEITSIRRIVYAEFQNPKYM